MVDKSEEIKEYVRETYARLARSAEKAGQSCCEASSSSECCGTTSKDEYAQRLGYSEEEIADLPESVVSACAGCGNPTAIAGLDEGEVVLDLGSGGGIDVFLAAKKVGPSGKAIGVDMTQDMIDLARKNAEEMGITNVEFRLGDIEKLPVEDESVDVIISNCVINLAPDKDMVFSEAFRVLRPGGRVMVSDIVTGGELPDDIKNDPDAWAGCVAGALKEGEYLEKMRNVGFSDVRVVSKEPYREFSFSVEIEAHKPA